MWIRVLLVTLLITSIAFVEAKKKQAQTKPIQQPKIQPKKLPTKTITKQKSPELKVKTEEPTCLLSVVWPTGYCQKKQCSIAYLTNWDHQSFLINGLTQVNKKARKVGEKPELNLTLFKNQDQSTLRQNLKNYFPPNLEEKKSKTFSPTAWLKQWATNGLDFGIKHQNKYFEGIVSVYKSLKGLQKISNVTKNEVKSKKDLAKLLGVEQNSFSVECQKLSKYTVLSQIQICLTLKDKSFILAKCDAKQLKTQCSFPLTLNGLNYQWTKEQKWKNPSLITNYLADPQYDIPSPFKNNAAKTTEKLVQKPVEKLSKKQAEKPIQKPAQKSASEPVQNPAQKPAQKLAEKPSLKIPEKPTQKLEKTAKIVNKTSTASKKDADNKKKSEKIVPKTPNKQQKKPATPKLVEKPKKNVKKPVFNSKEVAGKVQLSWLLGQCYESNLRNEQNQCQWDQVMFWDQQSFVIKGLETYPNAKSYKKQIKALQKIFQQRQLNFENLFNETQQADLKQIWPQNIFEDENQWQQSWKSNDNGIDFLITLKEILPHLFSINNETDFSQFQRQYFEITQTYYNSLTKLRKLPKSSYSLYQLAKLFGVSPKSLNIQCAHDKKQKTNLLTTLDMCVKLFSKDNKTISIKTSECQNKQKYQGCDLGKDKQVDLLFWRKKSNQTDPYWGHKYIKVILPVSKFVKPEEPQSQEKQDIVVQSTQTIQVKIQPTETEETPEIKKQKVEQSQEVIVQSSKITDNQNSTETTIKQDQSTEQNLNTQAKQEEEQKQEEEKEEEKESAEQVKENEQEKKEEDDSVEQTEQINKPQVIQATLQTPKEPVLSQNQL